MGIINGTDLLGCSEKAKGLVNARQTAAVVVIVSTEAVGDPGTPLPVIWRGKLRPARLPGVPTPPRHPEGPDPDTPAQGDTDPTVPDAEGSACSR